MAHFAKVENGKVVDVIVAEQDVIDSGVLGNPSEWIQTSYNTSRNKHSQGGTPLRGNYAGIGHTYDAVNDVFVPPSPYPSWILNQNSWTWEAPVAHPTDLGTEEAPKLYDWDEESKSWKQTN